MKSTGTLRYSPKLIGDHASEKWWLVLDCDTSIVAYYRALYKVHRYKTQELIKPAWDSHITIIRNEEPPNPEHWEKYAGRSFEFEYGHDVHTNGEYWWVTVTCQPLMDLRTELGLPAPLFPFHLSIGHV